jgi:hypothetical protein
MSIVGAPSSSVETYQSTEQLAIATIGIHELATYAVLCYCGVR